MVTNHVPQPQAVKEKSSPTKLEQKKAQESQTASAEQLSEPPSSSGKSSVKPINNVVCEEEWFVLKKFQLKKALVIDDSKLPRNIRKVMEKLNVDNSFIELDAEKALMLAYAQGNPISNNGSVAIPGQIYDHSNEKEQYFSCHLPGMKAYFRQFKETISPEKLQKIDKELEQSESKRVDIKRVLMRFTKDQMIGYRLDQLQGQV